MTQITPPRLVRIGSWLAIPVHMRGVLYVAIASLCVVAVGVATLSMGDLGLAPHEIVQVLSGTADGPSAFVFERLRGPRLVVAIGAGAALAVAGGLFQTVTRNPLGSPDIIGLTSGAGAGAAAATLLWPGVVPVPAGAAAGALIAAGVVYVFTGNGFVSPARVIIAGIAVAAMSVAFIQYVVLIGLRTQSTELAAFIVGSLATRDWADASLIWLALLVLVPMAAGLSRRLQLIEMGDELADALGGKSRRTRTWSILVAVGLSAAAVSVIGPIAFVALTAPQIAKRVTGGTGVCLMGSAVTGALILVVADIIVQRVPVVEDLPVGIVTAGIGGVYLGYLLVGEWKKGTL